MPASKAGRSGDAALAVRSEALVEAVQAHRAADGEALRDIALHLDEQVEDLALLDALRHDLAAERVGETDGRLDHQTIRPVVDHAFDEALVDLDLVRRDLLQIIEGRQAGAVIVDGDAYADLAKARDH